MNPLTPILNRPPTTFNRIYLQTDDCGHTVTIYVSLLNSSVDNVDKTWPILNHIYFLSI